MPSVPMKQDYLPKQKKLNKEQKEETKRQQALVKDVIYPILLKHAKSVKGAKTILNTLVVGMDAIFMMDIKKYSEKRSQESLSSLNLEQAMNSGKDFKAEWELVEVLKNETVTTSKALIDGMDKELQRLIDKEMLERPLSELKTEFI